MPDIDILFADPRGTGFLQLISSLIEYGWKKISLEGERKRDSFPLFGKTVNGFSPLIWGVKKRLVKIGRLRRLNSRSSYDQLSVKAFIAL